MPRVLDGGHTTRRPALLGGAAPSPAGVPIKEPPERTDPLIRLVERLRAAGRMVPAGLQVLEAARADGSWDAYDAVEELVVPADLSAALATDPAAATGFAACSTSTKKQLLWWVTSAVRGS